MRRLTILSVMCLVLGLAAKSQAALETFDLSWSGASFGNAAMGTGTITFDPTLLNNPGVTDPIAVTAFSITISDATNAGDDGTFGLSDYAGGGGEIILDTNGGTLDFSKQLIGQPTSGNPFGTAFDSTAGDFNIFSNGNDGEAPDGTDYFTITTGGGDGDPLVLTSFAPAVTPPSGGGGSSAPLPSGLTLGLLCLGTLACGVRRYKLKAC
jgi:hypothetical protein